MSEANDLLAAPSLLRPLDTSRPDHVLLFERAFYRGFRESTHNQIIRWLWHWDDENQRLRTRVPYEDQRIWVSYEEDPPGHGVAVNWRMALLQSGAFGFSLPDSLREPGKTCEVLALFSWAHPSLTKFHAAWTELFRDLQGLGFQMAVATCARQILPLYRRMGATIIDQLTVDEQERYFLQFELVRTARWNARMNDSFRTQPSPRSPAEALANAVEGIGVLLHRLLPLFDVARGSTDPAFGLSQFKNSAVRMEALIHSQLSAASADPTLAAPISHRSVQLAQIARLWQSVTPFVHRVSNHPFASASSLVEPLELLVLTAVEAWEGDIDAAETLAALAASDRHRALDAIVAGAEEQGQPAAILRDIIQSFSESVDCLHTVASDLSGRETHRI
jgi:hypothetical protein